MNKYSAAVWIVLIICCTFLLATCHTQDQMTRRAYYQAVSKQPSQTAVPPNKLDALPGNDGKD